MKGLTPGQQRTVGSAQEVLDRSHQMDLGAASDRDLCRNTGRLEITVEQLLRVIRELQDGA